MKPLNVGVHASRLLSQCIQLITHMRSLLVYVELCSLGVPLNSFALFGREVALLLSW